MNFILVWVLVSSSANFINYSQPMQSQNECLIFKSKIESIKNIPVLKHQCVQITMGVAK